LYHDILKAIAANAAQLLFPALVQNLVIFFKGKAGAARPAAQPDLASCFFDYELTVARKAKRRIFFFITWHM
jgi:hypothetical protein